MLPDANNYLIIVPKLARCDNSLMHYFLNYGTSIPLCIGILALAVHRSTPCTAHSYRYMYAMRHKPRVGVRPVIRTVDLPVLLRSRSLKRQCPVSPNRSQATSPILEYMRLYQGSQSVKRLQSLTATLRAILDLFVTPASFRCARPFRCAR